MVQPRRDLAAQLRCRPEAMRILLIKPPKSRHMITAGGGEPLELEYLAAAVKDHDVDILDMRVDRGLVEKLDAFKPHFVGLTAYTCDANSAKQVMKEVKTFDRRIVTGVGGHHATFLPEDFALPFVDVVFLGMADLTFPEYMRVLEEGGDAASVSNLALRRDHGLVMTKRAPFAVDLDELPFPDRHLTRRYRKSYRDQFGKRTAAVLTSRGCPFRCNFCACWKLLDGNYLVRRPESVVDELAALPEDVHTVFFADDNTLHNVSRAWRLCRLIRERKIKREFSLFARADTIVKHPDLMEELKAVGLKHLTVGIESIHDSELDAIKKKTTVAMNSEAIKILQKLDIAIGAHFIVDPNFTREDFRELFRYVKERELFRPVFTVLTPFPGTDLYLSNHKKILIRDFDYYDMTHAIYPTRLGRKQFYQELRRLYLRAYSFRRYFLSLLKGLFVFSGRAGHGPKSRPDRLPFWTMVFLHLSLYPLLLRGRRIR